MIFQELQINNLKEIIENNKKEGKTIVWTNGCFDLIHPGHLETFKKAKELWDILVVWLNWKDNPYWNTKPWRPINDEEFRAKMLAWIKYIDYVYIFNDENPAKAVDILKPHYVLKGWDYYIKELKIENKNFEDKILEFNKIVEKKLVKKENSIIDITWIYKYFLENKLENEVKNIQGFMSEWLINVKKNWKVVLVPVLWNYSTTKIVDTIRPKEFFDLVIFFKKFNDKFKDLKEFISWYNDKLNINYFKKRDWRKFKQFQIYYFKLWQNIWWEINKKRPILILWKTNNFLNSKTILWAPITSLYTKDWKEKKMWKMDIFLKANKINWLKNDSIIKLGKILEIDKKRVLWYFWKLDEKLKGEVFNKLNEVFWIKK